MFERRLPNVIAIDLGAESCRVSLLQWREGLPQVDLVHRFSNAPVEKDATLVWDLGRILAELHEGLKRCGERSDAPIASIGVDGWAVDYVRVNELGMPLALPHCYRDRRTEAVAEEMHRHHPPHELFSLCGAQPARINSLYQLMADNAAGIPAGARWVNLPEYVLARLGGRMVAEYTNATHTGLVDIQKRRWCERAFEVAGLDRKAAPELVSTGCMVGTVAGDLEEMPVFRGTKLIAPACHDTASAVAAIPLEGEDWAYISSGTWSLVGTMLGTPVLSREACEAGFTNLGGAGDRVCFHRNVNGMWLLKQTMEQICGGDGAWTMAEVIAAAERLPRPAHLLDVDDPELLMMGRMASRINAQLGKRGLPRIEEYRSSVPEFATLIFHSLAERYGEVLLDVARLTGKNFSQVAMVGGGSLNHLLNRLTAAATGLEVVCGAVESSTIGNLAIQLSVLEGKANERSAIAGWARRLSEGQAG